MLTVDIPGFGRLELAHLVLDYNGTLAVGGVLLPGVSERLQLLAAQIRIHVLTADTFGSVEQSMEGVPCTVHILPQEKQDEGKRRYVTDLGAEGTVTVGNGRNDAAMLRASALGMAVIQEEGAAAAALMAADVCTASITAALDLLIHPLRLVATLRT